MVERWIEKARKELEALAIVRIDSVYRIQIINIHT